MDVFLDVAAAALLGLYVGGVAAVTFAAAEDEYVRGKLAGLLTQGRLWERVAGGLAMATILPMILSVGGIMDMIRAAGRAARRMLR